MYAMQSSLITKDIYIPRRTSIRLEAEFWDGLADIASAEGVKLDVLTTRIANNRTTGTLTSAVRVFVLEWFRKQTKERDKSNG